MIKMLPFTNKINCFVLLDLSNASDLLYQSRTLRELLYKINSNIQSGAYKS